MMRSCPKKATVLNVKSRARHGCCSVTVQKCAIVAITPFAERGIVFTVLAGLLMNVNSLQQVFILALKILYPSILSLYTSILSIQSLQNSLQYNLIWSFLHKISRLSIYRSI